MWTTWFTNSVLDTAITSVAGNLQVALSTTEPEIDDTAATGVYNVTDPSGGAYARQALNTTAWAASTDRIKETNAAITFPAATADWGTVTHIVVYRVSDGKCVFVGALDEELEVLAGGDNLVIPAGLITLALPL